MNWKLRRPKSWPLTSEFVWWEAQGAEGTYTCVYDKEREFGDGWVAAINGDFIGSGGNSVAVRQICSNHRRGI